MRKAFLLIPVFLLGIAAHSFPQDSSVNVYIIKTKYCDIIYGDKKDLGDFLWRLSGKRFELAQDMDLAKTCVDRIVERVEDVLDMKPLSFHVKIQILPDYESGSIAVYSHDDKTITVYSDRITDGILSHEMAHAIICNYFIHPPPPKMQEILSQYVDKHLWDDY